MESITNILEEFQELLNLEIEDILSKNSVTQLVTMPKRRNFIYSLNKICLEIKSHLSNPNPQNLELCFYRYLIYYIEDNRDKNNGYSFTYWNTNTHNFLKDVLGNKFNKNDIQKQYVDLLFDDKISFLHRHPSDITESKLISNYLMFSKEIEYLLIETDNLQKAVGAVDACKDKLKAKVTLLSIMLTDIDLSIDKDFYLYDFTKLDSTYVAELMSLLNADKDFVSYSNVLEAIIHEILSSKCSVLNTLKLNRK